MSNFKNTQSEKIKSIFPQYNGTLIIRRLGDFQVLYETPFSTFWGISDHYAGDTKGVLDESTRPDSPWLE